MQKRIAAIYANAAKLCSKYIGNQVSGARNILTNVKYDAMGNTVYVNPYLLDEVTVNAPDLRAAVAARDRKNHFGTSKPSPYQNVNVLPTFPFPNGSKNFYPSLVANWLPNWMSQTFRHPVQTTRAFTNYIYRHTPFLRGESGSYVKDLSGSRLSIITPDTKNIKSILGNSFIEQTNTNNIRQARQFKEAGSDTLVGDRYIPLSNYNLFMGIVDGKIKVAPIGDFNDEDVVVPVPNRTDLALTLNRQSTADQLSAMNQERLWREYKGQNLSRNAIADSVKKYENLGRYSLGYQNQKGMFIPMQGLTKDKSLLVAPNGNSLFLNNLSKFSPQQDSLVNDFLMRNNGAYPILLDNGRYSHFLEGDGATYDNYMAVDVYRDPKYVWLFGEVAK